MQHESFIEKMFPKLWKSRLVVAFDCIALKRWGKHKRKMVIRDIKLAGKQSATIELIRRVYSIDTRLHYRYIGISELR